MVGSIKNIAAHHQMALKRPTLTLKGGCSSRCFNDELPRLQKKAISETAARKKNEWKRESPHSMPHCFVFFSMHHLCVCAHTESDARGYFFLWLPVSAFFSTRKVHSSDHRWMLCIIYTNFSPCFSLIPKLILNKTRSCLYAPAGFSVTAWCKI